MTLDSLRPVGRVAAGVLLGGLALAACVGAGLLVYDTRVRIVHTHEMTVEIYCAATGKCGARPPQQPETPRNTSPAKPGQGEPVGR